jgi:hypothetical protein
MQFPRCLTTKLWSGNFCAHCGCQHTPLKSPPEAHMPELSPKPRVALGADHAGFPIKESSGQAIKMVRTFLNTAFVGGRHARRVEKIAVIEQDERKKN